MEALLCLNKLKIFPRFLCLQCCKSPFFFLFTCIRGNPHSINPTSAKSTEFVEAAVDDVFHFFNLSPKEYCIVFTQNASGTLSFPYLA